MSESSPMRLNKFIAKATGTSRREADDLIAQGKIRLNETVAVIGNHVQTNDVVWLDGKRLDIPTSTYLLFHKPVGYVCSRKRQGETPTIYELMPPPYHHLKPVGRLDKDSSGILLLTDDGDAAHQMTHPRFRKVKHYIVTLTDPLAPLHQQMIADHGVALEDGVSQFQLSDHSDDRKQWEITMYEGRNRQIRRTFAALGYTVHSLHRTQFGPYRLDDLAPGEIRLLVSA